MLENISIKDGFRLPKASGIKKKVSAVKSFETPLMDSFVKSTAETAPPLFGVVATESFLTAKSKDLKVSNVMKNDLKNIFLPLLLIISGASAIYDDYKKHEQN